MKKFKLIYQSSLSLLIATSMMLSGCAKDVPCNVKEKHIHLYVDDKDKLIRYIPGEKEYIGDFKRTDSYELATCTNEIIANNNLYNIADNYVYLSSLYESYQPHREEYVKEVINGPYLTITNDLQFKIITGKHNVYNWELIDYNTSTSNLVRDVTYSIKVYCLKDNHLESATFNSLDAIPNAYKYFNILNVIKMNASEEYYLDKARVRAK